MMWRSIRPPAAAINGLSDFLQVERKCVPGDVLYEAGRLEYLLFNGYDPHFAGDEPLDCEGMWRYISGSRGVGVDVCALLGDGLAKFRETPNWLRSEW
jgi:hypothetical protein